MADDETASPGSCSRTPPDGNLIVSPFVGPIAMWSRTVAGAGVLPGPMFIIMAYGLLQCKPSSVEFTSIGSAS